MNNDSANAKAHLIRELNDAMNYAEQLADPYGKVTMVTTQEASASNGSGNWLFAVGRYRTWAVADVVACGDKYYMDWTFNFREPKGSSMYCVKGKSEKTLLGRGL